MRIHRRIAELVMRSAAAVGGRIGESEKGPVSVGVYRLAGAIVGLLGGRLESRVMSFVVPEAGADPKVAEVVDSIRGALKTRGIVLRVAETRLSRDEAVASKEVRVLVPEGVSRMIFVELQVPTHQYWKATALIDDELKHLREVAGEG
jgi:hypothetical protein